MSYKGSKPPIYSPMHNASTLINPLTTKNNLNYNNLKITAAAAPRLEAGPQGSLLRGDDSK